MLDIEKCCDCEFSHGGGSPECGDGYTYCEKLNEIVYYEYGPTVEDICCPLEDLNANKCF